MKAKLVVLPLLLVFFASSCKKDEVKNPAPVTKGNIHGSVNLYDQGVTSVDNSNMTVSVEGSNPFISDTTDASGNFTLVNAPKGTITIVYSKPTYGTYKRVNYNHVPSSPASTLTDTPSLGQMSTTTISSLNESTSGSTVTLSVSTTPPSSNGAVHYLRFFFSTQPNVSKDNFEHVLGPILAQIDPYNFNMIQQTFDALGYTSGQTVYARCYSDAYWANSYFDPDLGRDVFPNLNATSAPAVSFVVP